MFYDNCARSRALLCSYQLHHRDDSNCTLFELCLLADGTLWRYLASKARANMSSSSNNLSALDLQQHVPSYRMGAFHYCSHNWYLRLDWIVDSVLVDFNQTFNTMNFTSDSLISTSMMHLPYGLRKRTYFGF